MTTPLSLATLDNICKKNEFTTDKFLYKDYLQQPFTNKQTIVY